MDDILSMALESSGIAPSETVPKMNISPVKPFLPGYQPETDIGSLLAGIPSTTSLLDAGNPEDLGLSSRRKLSVADVLNAVTVEPERPATAVEVKDEFDFGALLMNTIGPTDLQLSSTNSKNEPMHPVSIQQSISVPSSRQHAGGPNGNTLSSQLAHQATSYQPTKSETMTSDSGIEAILQDLFGDPTPTKTPPPPPSTFLSSVPTSSYPSPSSSSSLSESRPTSFTSLSMVSPLMVRHTANSVVVAAAIAGSKSSLLSVVPKSEKMLLQNLQAGLMGYKGPATPTRSLSVPAPTRAAVSPQSTPPVKAAGAGTEQYVRQVVQQAKDEASEAEATAKANPSAPPVADQDVELEESDYGAGDTYAVYKPAKLRLGQPHPDAVVESSTLSSVEPPAVWMDLKLPAFTIDTGRLSSLQLEAVVYACQQHMNILGNSARAGFLVGDGAGVGKGRIISGIIFQNYLEGRKKSLWLSVSNDLKFDAIRDLRDVGAKKVNVYSLNKFRYGKISGKRNDRVKKGVIFATYSALIGRSNSGGKYNTRLNQILHWLGPGFDGLVILDECHKAKNLFPSKSGKPSKTGAAVLELQERLPKARIVYCSATGASEPRNMGYMSRLGIWGPGTQFQDFMDFIKAVERRGVGAMEIVAMDMKLRGMYIARQLSFHGVSFAIKEVQLSEDFIDMYDAAVELWVDAKRMFEEAAELLDLETTNMWSLFWAAHQRFFKYLCIAAKVKEAIAMAKKAVRDGKCVVIGLQSTGEARTLEQLEQARGELTEFVSTAKGVLESLIKKHFPSNDQKKMGGGLLDLFNDDPTLPLSLRKRLRDDGILSSDDSDSSVDSDSESSSDSEDSDSDSPSSGDSSDMEDHINPFKMFESSQQSWSRTKAAKTSSSKKRKVEKNDTKGKTKAAIASRRASVAAIPSRDKTLLSLPLTSALSAPASENSSPRGSPKFPGGGSSIRDSLASISRTSTQNMMESAKTLGGSPSMKSSLVCKLKEELLTKLNVLSPYLPHNTLDELIMGLGGPHQVAEMTGRRGRMIKQTDGSVKYQLRTQNEVPLEMLNLAEKQAFMDGEKSMAIISEAASSGISLQADRRVKNQKKRVHITLELPWSADKAIQQFGRTHRSNQTSAPDYVFLISALAGEKRFASAVAKRLESLGALTHGDRRAGESRDLSRFNIDTKYGREALDVVLQSIRRMQRPLVSGPEYNEEFFEKITPALVGSGVLHKSAVSGRIELDKDATNLAKFLNRLLGVPVKLQNQLFNYFSETLAVLMLQAKRMGKYDGGILDFGAGGESVEVIETKEYIGDPTLGTGTTYLYKVLIERGVSFSTALERLEHDCQQGEGFYLSKKVYLGERRVAILVKSTGRERAAEYLVTRPNTGLAQRHEKLGDIKSKYTRVTTEEAQMWWNHQYEHSSKLCQHLYTLGKCKAAVVGGVGTGGCGVGLRRRQHYILGGSVLGIWTHLEHVFSRHTAHGYKMQIVRVQTTDGRKLVGIEIPSVCVIDLNSTLTTLIQKLTGDSGMDELH